MGPTNRFVYFLNLPATAGTKVSFNSEYNCKKHRERRKIYEKHLITFFNSFSFNNLQVNLPRNDRSIQNMLF